MDVDEEKKRKLLVDDDSQLCDRTSFFFLLMHMRLLSIVFFLLAPMTYIERQSIRPQSITPTIPFVELSIKQAIYVRGAMGVILYLCVEERKKKKRIIQERERESGYMYIYKPSVFLLLVRRAQRQQDKFLWHHRLFAFVCLLKRFYSGK